jgi:solute carrier family 45 protein 1/2/4
MGVEINKLTMNGASAPGIAASSTRAGVTMITSASLRANAAADTELEVLRLNHRDSDSDSDEEDPSSLHSNIPSTGELTGIYLGVLNVYTTLPQFVGTFISWIVFTILEPSATKLPKDADASDAQWMNLDKDQPNAIAICLFIGALSALVAAEATRRLQYVL